MSKSTLKLVSSRPCKGPITRIRQAWIEGSSLQRTGRPDFYRAHEEGPGIVRVYQLYVDSKNRHYSWLGLIEFNNTRIMASDVEWAFYRGEYRIIKEIMD